jgi:ArsR family transcriptional regulator
VDAKSQARYGERALVLKALAHPSRLLLVERLEQRARCVSELTRLVGADVTTVSKHLAVLKRAGIVAAERRGMQVYYRLAMPCVMGFFNCVSEVLRVRAKEHAENDDSDLRTGLRQVPATSGQCCRGRERRGARLRSNEGV